jgi:molybdate transport system substrate-binding protein
MLFKHEPFRFYSIAFILHPSFLIFALILSFTGCSRHQGERQDKQTAEINVAAAANLTDAFTELGREFTTRTGIRVVYSFGATADLARQIENDAPFDVFASADVENVDRLEGKGLLTAETRRLYARGRLALWTPPEARINLARIEDLNGALVERIGIAKPDVAPYGRAAVEALRALNLWPQLEPKVVYGQNVSQVRQYAATGNVDAAFIPLALVRAGEGRVIEVDERLHQPINQSIAVIKASQKQEAARRFVLFVMSEEGQAMLERYGYRRP